MDALRPEVAAKLLSPIEFAVKTIRVADGWAFVRVMPQRPGGAKINIRQTPMAKYVEWMAFGPRPFCGYMKVNGTL